MTAPPKVAVLIAAWRAAETLPRATAAALAQKGTEVEVIIVDDASTDATFATARALAADPRVTALQLDRNTGPAAARNRALAHARAPWIGVLDADDTMHPDRLARMLALATRTGADIVLGNLALPDGTPFLTVPVGPVTLRDWLRGNLATANAPTLGYLKPLIRRDFLTTHGLCYDESLRNGEDFHLILAALAHGARVWLSPAPDYVYHRHAGSVSHRADPGQMRALARADRAAASRLADPVARHLLLRRALAIARLATAEAALADLRHGAPRSAAATLLRDPAALGRFTRQLARSLAKRLRRHP